MPLVGKIDARRADRIMGALLAGIVAHQASIVIFDITGAGEIDSTAVDHVVKTARAAGLLGAKVLLVGVSTNVAQVLVELGADLSGIKTLMNLQAGLEYAFRARH